MGSSNDEFARYLEEAVSADLSAVEGRGLVSVIRRDGDLVVDSDDNALCVLNPAAVDQSDESWKHFFQLFLRECHEVLDGPYRLIFIMSNFKSEVWFARWLSQMRQRLTDTHRTNLNAVSIVHPSWSLRLMCGAGYAWYGKWFWDKLHYVDRIDELWLDGVMDQATVREVIPASVVTYESHLEEEAAHLREQARLNGAPLAPPGH